MADRIEGVAILTGPRADPLIEYLHFVCVRENGDRAPWRDMIPVAPFGAIPPGRYAWGYEVNGDRLRVRPSVKMSWQRCRDDAGELLPEEQWTWVEFFHNEGDWTVAFERWTSDATDDAAIYDRMLELNRALLTRSSQDVRPENPSPAPKPPTPAQPKSSGLPPAPELSGYQLSVVRRRMEQLGENEATARAAVLGNPPPR